MAHITFTVSFDSGHLSQEQIDSAKEYIYEYCATGAFTDEFNILLSNGYNLYCYPVDSSPDFFKYWVSLGWSSPYKKGKLPDPKDPKL